MKSINNIPQFEIDDLMFHTTEEREEANDKLRNWCKLQEYARKDVDSFMDIHINELRSQLAETKQLLEEAADKYLECVEKYNNAVDSYLAEKAEADELTATLKLAEEALDRIANPPTCPACSIEDPHPDVPCYCFDINNQEEAEKALATIKERMKL